MSELFAGLMSGTSMDGVDGVIADFAGSTQTSTSLKVRSHAYRPFPEKLREDLLALNSVGGSDELHKAALAANALAKLYAEVMAALLAQARLSASDVRAVGTHGQTVRHRPGSGDGIGYSLQINNPALLAELSGLNVIADFRSRDIAAGGQGAPLVPAFHRALFARSGETTAVLNLGGISNLTVLSAGGGTRGFDCGPANVLMDLWCTQQKGQAFDADGSWAASGHVLPELLQLLLADGYFSRPPPKSTGRDLFNAQWLHSRLQQYNASVRPEDVQATLCELTAATCGDAVLHHASTAAELLVCGGGTFNKHLMQRLTQRLPGVPVRPTDARGLPAMHVEAAAFAWLAYAHVNRIPGNLSAVTGAAGPRILGALYPAG